MGESKDEENMKKIVILAILGLVMCGCANQGEKQDIETGNKDMNVVFLFEVDGVRVYRFRDAGRYVYFTNTNGKCQYDYTVSTGKTTYTERMETICSCDSVE